MNVGDVYKKNGEWFVVTFLWYDGYFDGIKDTGETIHREKEETFSEYEKQESLNNSWWNVLKREKEFSLNEDLRDTVENRRKALKILGGAKAVGKGLGIGYSTMRRFIIKGRLNKRIFNRIKTLCIKAEIKGSEFWENGITSVSEELNRKSNKGDKKGTS